MTPKEEVGEGNGADPQAELVHVNQAVGAKPEEKAADEVVMQQDIEEHAGAGTPPADPATDKPVKKRRGYKKRASKICRKKEKVSKKKVKGDGSTLPPFPPFDKEMPELVQVEWLRTRAHLEELK